MGKELGPGVGFEYPSFEVKWLKRDLLLFAASIGATYPDELHFLYVSSSMLTARKLPDAMRVLKRLFAT